MTNIYGNSRGKTLPDRKLSTFTHGSHSTVFIHHSVEGILRPIAHEKKHKHGRLWEYNEEYENMYIYIDICIYRYIYIGPLYDNIIQTGNFSIDRVFAFDVQSSRSVGQGQIELPRKL